MLESMGLYGSPVNQPQERADSVIFNLANDKPIGLCRFLLKICTAVYGDPQTPHTPITFRWPWDRVRRSAPNCFGQTQSISPSAHLSYYSLVATNVVITEILVIATHRALVWLETLSCCLGAPENCIMHLRQLACLSLVN